ncbi:MAG: uracil-DNA glycosylase [Burkholderiales bacterium]|nr:uracil-DNA glycosylase [Burkholderiales bacterium]
MTADDLPAAFESIPPVWREALPGWTESACGAVIGNVRRKSGARPIAPPDPFRALRFVPPAGVKVVVFGQDPYPKPGVADGLAFSAHVGRPPSLRRVFDVLETDRPGYTRPVVWSLDRWARQGVLLLNPTLTIECGAIGSHMDCGWQALTSDIVRALCSQSTPPVFLLWGRPAQSFFDSTAIGRADVRVLRTRHPSNDFRREFMAGGSHFVATQRLVDWWVVDEPAADSDIV